MYARTPQPMIDKFYALPKFGLPTTEYAGRKGIKWLLTDTRENYLNRGGHPLYGEQDIEYNFNAFGYRCPEFGPTRALRVLAIGCSHVMGVGLPCEALFHELFAERLRSQIAQEVLVWNVGVPGASNDHIARMLHLAIPYLDPQIVLLNFTHVDRREYFSIQGTWYPYCPGYTPQDPIGRSVKRHFDCLSSPYDDDLNLFRNYKAVESLLSARFWLFSMTALPEIDADPFDNNLARLRSHVDLTRYAGALHHLDVARDHSHYGPISHKALAEDYWSCFNSRDGLTSLETEKTQLQRRR